MNAVYFTMSLLCWIFSYDAYYIILTMLKTVYYSIVICVSSMDYRLQLYFHMADDDMLTCFGGIDNNSLTYLINNLQNQTDKENNIFGKYKTNVIR